MDILHHRELRVVAGTNRVGRCQHCTPRKEARAHFGGAAQQKLAWQRAHDFARAKKNQAGGLSCAPTAGASVQRGDDARLGHADCLLLHHLVQLQLDRSDTWQIKLGCATPFPASCVRQEAGQSCGELLPCTQSSARQDPMHSARPHLASPCCVPHRSSCQTRQCNRCLCQTAPAHRSPEPSPLSLGPAGGGNAVGKRRTDQTGGFQSEG